MQGNGLCRAGRDWARFVPHLPRCIGSSDPNPAPIAPSGTPSSSLAAVGDAPAALVSLASLAEAIFRTRKKLGEARPFGGGVGVVVRAHHPTVLLQNKRMWQ